MSDWRRIIEEYETAPERERSTLGITKILRDSGHDINPRRVRHVLESTKLHEII